MKKIIAFFTIITIVLLGATIGIKAFDNSKINVLIYGVDGRENDEIERSDAIILMNYNFNTNVITTTSIPRDSYVQISCKNNQYDKINHAYAYGKQECLNKTISNLFGLDNVRNIMLDFNDVVDLIDYFGLIEITPDFTFCQSDEKYERTYCFEKGKTILIDGKAVLAYMRNRKSLPNGDFDRIKNQRKILKIVINTFLKMSLLEKIKCFNYMKNKLVTDLEISDFNFKKMINSKEIKLNEYTLKGEDYFNKYYYYYKLDISYLEKIKKYYV